MKWLKFTGIIFLLLLAVLAALPFFISLNDYIPLIENKLSAKIDEPVTINNIQLRLLPTPHINVNDVMASAMSRFISTPASSVGTSVSVSRMAPSSEKDSV